MYHLYYGILWANWTNKYSCFQRKEIPNLIIETIMEAARGISWKSAVLHWSDSVVFIIPVNFILWSNTQKLSTLFPYCLSLFNPQFDD